MKHKLKLAVAAALSLTFAAQAQTISVGPRVGLNVATLRATDGKKEYRASYNETAKTITGAHFGVVVNYAVNDLFSIQPELLYAQKGGKIDINTDGYYRRYEHQRNYLELPLLSKVSFGNAKAKGFVTAGPYAGYWLSGKHKWDIGWPNYSGKGEADYEFIKEGEEYNIKYSRLDVGASIGVGAAYRIGSGAMNLDVRYGHGFSNDTKYRDGRDSTMYKSTNRVIGISLAYLFGAK